MIALASKWGMQQVIQYRIIFPAVLLTACSTWEGSKENKEGGQGGAKVEHAGTVNETGSEGDAVKLEGTDEADIKVAGAMSVRDYVQFPATVYSLTGTTAEDTVPIEGGTLGNLYSSVQTSLPTTNDIDNFSGAAYLAMFKFASGACAVAARKSDPEVEKVFGTTIRNREPLEIFGGDNTENIAITLVEGFLGRSGLNRDDENVSALLTFMTETMTELDPVLNDGQLSEVILSSACTIVLTSAASTFYGG